MSDDEIIEAGEHASLALGEFCGRVRGLEDAGRVHEVLTVLEHTSESLHRTIVEVIRYARTHADHVAEAGGPTAAAALRSMVEALRAAARAAETSNTEVQYAITDQTGIDWPTPAKEPLLQRMSELETDASASLDAGQPQLPGHER